MTTKVVELFNNQLRNTSLAEDSETADQSPDSIAAALQELLMGINSKIPLMEIMMIVNTKVHPNFITAFGLQFG
jgi:hypothetical protein